MIIYPENSKNSRRFGIPVSYPNRWIEKRMDGQILSDEVGVDFRFPSFPLAPCILQTLSPTRGKILNFLLIFNYNLFF